MLDFAHIHDKKFAVIFVEDDGTEDGKWTVLAGVAKWRDGHLSVHRGMDVPEFPIPDDTLDRVKPVRPEAREILEEADFCTMLSIGPLPEDTDLSACGSIQPRLTRIEVGDWNPQNGGWLRPAK